MFQCNTDIEKPSCCIMYDDADGNTLVFGDPEITCYGCNRMADFLCDYPVGKGKTCDRKLCPDHAAEIGPEVHYCDIHNNMWIDFRESKLHDKKLREVARIIYEL